MRLDSRSGFEIPTDILAINAKATHMHLLSEITQQALDIRHVLCFTDEKAMDAFHVFQVTKRKKIRNNSLRETNSPTFQ